MGDSGGQSRSRESTFTPGCGARLPGWGVKAGQQGPTALTQTATMPHCDTALGFRTTSELLAGARVSTKSNLSACSFQGLKASDSAPPETPNSPPSLFGLGPGQLQEERGQGRVSSEGQAGDTQLSSSSFPGIMPFHPQRDYTCLRMKKLRFGEVTRKLQTRD